MDSGFTSPDSTFVALNDKDLEVELGPRPPTDLDLQRVLLHTWLTPQTAPPPGDLLSRMHRIAAEQAARHRPAGVSRALRTVLSNLAVILGRLGDDDGAALIRAEIASLGK